jgi:hypothetical protein
LTSEVEPEDRKGESAMQHIVWVIGAFIGLWGFAVIVRPEWMNRFLAIVSKGWGIWCAAAAKSVVGVLFLILATGCRMPWVVIVLGVLMASALLVTLVVTPGKFKLMVEWIQKKPLWVYRFWGILAILFGGIVLFAGMPK